MEKSPLRLIKRSSGVLAVDEDHRLPASCARHPRPRQVAPWLGPHDIVYVSMTNAEGDGVRQRLRAQSRNKVGLWTHYSLFEVWPTSATTSCGA
ncbi:MAG: hypothetical protein U5K43_10055 [Halofilum sp. (in: g-proteobacteria)]|nr:hypothetical protein [Halofilum sp. (in: g-proteobacteria)]